MRTRFTGAVAFAVVTVAGIGIYLAWAAVATWCQHFFGFANGDGNGSHYLFFSGSGSDLTELTIIVAGVHIYYRFTCHEPMCFWPGHLMADRHTRSCWHHHPEGRPQRGHVRRRYEQHQVSRDVALSATLSRIETAQAQSPAPPAPAASSGQQDAGKTPRSGKRM